MTTIQHVWFADELVDATSAGRLSAEASTIPGPWVVTLQVGERPALTRDDELIHCRFVEIGADQIELLICATPPSDDVWFAEPSPNQRQVVDGHRTKLVHATPNSQALFSDSMVTLRLVNTQISAAISSDLRTMASASSGPSSRARAEANA